MAVTTELVIETEGKKFSILDEYLSEPEETLEISSHELDITIAHNKDDEAEKEIGAIFKRPEDLQIKSKEYQPLVLVKPPIVPCIFVKPYKGWKLEDGKRGVLEEEIEIHDSDEELSEEDMIDMNLNAIVPKEGMIFNTLDEATLAWLWYAMSVGFVAKDLTTTIHKFDNHF
ncbi:hypothetical protein Scep_002176 [Stephania cephalantha]|uniref:Uncharacterized protein n=1 Tax=Stephania cephalantha TaxID=152367 RepID=A0AAP0LAI6_9MAGN